MTTNGRRLFSMWRIAPFFGVASALVGERLLMTWPMTWPFSHVSLADFLHTKRHSRRASFLTVMPWRLLSQ